MNTIALPYSAAAPDLFRGYRNTLHALFLCCGIVQMAIVLPNLDGACCALLAVIGSMATVHISLRQQIFEHAPIPAMMVLLFNVASLSGALVLKTASLQSIASALLVPRQSFSLLFVAQACALVSLTIFCRTRWLRTRSARSALALNKTLHFFRWPSDAQLLLAGAIGLIARATTGQFAEL